MQLQVYKILGIAVLAASLISCAQPDSVRRINSPNPNIFVTIEEYGSSGPTSNTTRVFANFQSGGQTERKLVLEGGNLTIAKVTWGHSAAGDIEDTLCIARGFTVLFYNQISLYIDRAEINVHSRLREFGDADDCPGSDLNKAQ